MIEKYELVQTKITNISFPKFKEKTSLRQLVHSDVCVIYIEVIEELNMTFLKFAKI